MVTQAFLLSVQVCNTGSMDCQILSLYCQIWVSAMRRTSTWWTSLSTLGRWSHMMEEARPKFYNTWWSQGNASASSRRTSGGPTYSQTLRYSAVYLLCLVGNAYRLPTSIVRDTVTMSCCLRCWRRTHRKLKTWKIYRRRAVCWIRQRWSLQNVSTQCRIKVTTKEDWRRHSEHSVRVSNSVNWVTDLRRWRKQDRRLGRSPEDTRPRRDAEVRQRNWRCHILTDTKV